MDCTYDIGEKIHLATKCFFGLGFLLLLQQSSSSHVARHSLLRTGGTRGRLWYRGTLVSCLERKKGIFQTNSTFHVGKQLGVDKMERALVWGEGVE